MEIPIPTVPDIPGPEDADRIFDRIDLLFDRIEQLVVLLLIVIGVMAAIWIASIIVGRRGRS